LTRTEHYYASDIRITTTDPILHQLATTIRDLRSLLAFAQSLYELMPKYTIDVNNREYFRECQEC
jgi:hypothetical protein